MSVAVQRISPPTLPVRAADLPGGRVLQMPRNVLGVWSEPCFDELVVRSENFGGRVLLLNDPETARQVLGGGSHRASFALAEAQLVLALLIHHNCFTLADERLVLPVAIMTLGANRRPFFKLTAVPKQGKA